MRQSTKAAEAQAANDATSLNALLIFYEDDAMCAHMHAFNHRVQACLGKTLALAQLKLAKAALAQRCAAVRLANAHQSVGDMHITDAFTLTPNGRK